MCGRGHLEIEAAEDDAGATGVARRPHPADHLEHLLPAADAEQTAERLGPGRGGLDGGQRPGGAPHRIELLGIEPFLTGKNGVRDGLAVHHEAERRH